ncbi:MAG: hypothetical protein WC055_14555 [Melioribacteraceae bacterium]
MKNQENYIQEISEIRSMMERSSKFLSLSGWSGIIAGIYALAGAFIASYYLNFNPDRLFYDINSSSSFIPIIPNLILLAILILFFTLSTAILLSYNKAKKKGEVIWNAASRQLLINLFVPIIAGSIFIWLLFINNIAGLLAPASLLFYGLALFNASKFTYGEVKFLGIIQISLGLISFYFIEYSLMFWAIGFGIVHIFYGIFIYMHYERD